MEILSIAIPKDMVGVQGVRPPHFTPASSCLVTISVSRRIIPFRLGSCLSKLERVKANSIEIAKVMDYYHIPAV